MLKLAALLNKYMNYICFQSQKTSFESLHHFSQNYTIEFSNKKSTRGDRFNSGRKKIKFYRAISRLPQSEELMVTLKIIR